MSDAGLRDGAALDAADAAPAGAGRSRPIVFPLILMAINTGGLDAATNLPGFPADTYLDFAIAVPFMQGALFACINAGAALARDVETGFLKRLAMTPMQRAALLIGQLGGVMVVALVSALIYLAVGFAAGMDFEAGAARRAGAARARDADRARVRRARRVRRAALGLGRGRAGLLPAVLRPALPVLDEPAAAADRAGLVPLDRDLQPGLVPDRGDPLVHHHRLGRARRWRSGFGVAIVIAAAAVAAASSALRTRLVRT